MQKKILVCGSIAYDSIMTYDGEFESAFAPSQMTNLSASFYAEKREVFFGGCSANIAYNLKLIGESPYIFGVAGNDFEQYSDRLKEIGLPTDYIDIDTHNPTAAAFVLNDRNHKQITVFAPGAMNNPNKGMTFDAIKACEFALAVVAPDMAGRMLNCAGMCRKLNIPYLLDPGQATMGLSADHLAFLIDDCDGIIVNDYEADMVCDKLSKSMAEIAGNKYLIETLGEKGVNIYQAGEVLSVPAIPGLSEVCVTGCGDAFRGGFIHGLMAGESLKRACEMGCVTASFALAKVGTQNHEYTILEFTTRLKKHYS